VVKNQMPCTISQGIKEKKKKARLSKNFNGEKGVGKGKQKTEKKKISRGGGRPEARDPGECGKEIGPFKQQKK